jgi:acyl-CoA reductase-like NAD-dependent aldehyde dehydrogenase
MSIMAKILGKDREKATRELEGELKGRIANLHLKMKSKNVPEAEKEEIRKTLDRLEFAAKEELERCSGRNGQKKA